MEVDRGGFLLFVSALALGGVGGYAASELDLVRHLPGRRVAPVALPETPRAPVDAGAPVAVGAGSAAAVAVDAGAACDDTFEEPEACPPIGAPTVEGGCGAFTANRCNDFKQTMKPRVARVAVACLNRLAPAERCDPKRVDLCAHLALVNACADGAASIGASCDAIARSCTPSPSRTECGEAMAGLRDVGRTRLVECMKKHCLDRGIVGCEAMIKQP